MPQIISILRNKSNVLENGVPAEFTVGLEVTNGPVVKEIKYVPFGTSWCRRAHYEVYFEGSAVKRLIPEEEVVDIAVDTTVQEKIDKKKKAATVAGEPDLSVQSE